MQYSVLDTACLKSLLAGFSSSQMNIGTWGRIQLNNVNLGTKGKDMTSQKLKGVGPGKVLTLASSLNSFVTLG